MPTKPTTSEVPRSGGIGASDIERISELLRRAARLLHMDILNGNFMQHIDMEDHERIVAMRDELDAEREMLLSRAQKEA